MYFFVAECPMLLSRVTEHKITNFRCKYLATMATGNDNNDDGNEDGVMTTMTTTTTTTTMATTCRQRDTTMMAANNDDNEVDGNGVTGNGDGVR